MLTESEDDVRQKAVKLGRSLARRKLEGLSWSMVRDMSMAGGGSLPATGIPTYCLVLEHDSLDAEALQSALRHHEPPVISRVKDDALLLDMRTVEAGEVGELAEAVAAVVSGSENL